MLNESSFLSSFSVLTWGHAPLTLANSTRLCQSQPCTEGAWKELTPSNKHPWLAHSPSGWESSANWDWWQTLGGESRVSPTEMLQFAMVSQMHNVTDISLMACFQTATKSSSRGKAGCLCCLWLQLKETKWHFAALWSKAQCPESLQEKEVVAGVSSKL